MEYTVKRLSQLAGVSPRTLRYYDQIGLLHPARINSSGYRIYGQTEVDFLQQILFFRELGFPLAEIQVIMTSPEFSRLRTLQQHHDKLLEKRRQLDELIANVEKSIAHGEGRIKMSDQEKFQGFKKRLVEDNEEKYGSEVREKYGHERVEKSNQKIMNMTQAQYDEVTELSNRLMGALKEAFDTGDPGGDLAQKAADLHRQWLCYYWPEYDKEAHAGLTQTYVDDERFSKYYDKDQPGLAAFLRDAIHIFVKKDCWRN